MIKTILFDFFGVVVNNITKHPNKKFHKVIEKLAIGLDTGSKTEKQFIKQLIKELDINLSVTELRKTFIKNDKKNIKIKKGVLELIEKLKKDYEIILATNVSRELSSRCEEDGKYDAFDKNKRFFSYKIKSAKPDKKFFLHILNKLDIKPEETLIIDDSAENVLGAKKIKMNGIVFKNLKQVKKELYTYLK